MGPIGMPELIIILIVMLLIPIGLVGFIYLLVKQCNKPSPPPQPPPLPPEH